MKYMLMMHAPAGPYKIMNWSKTDFENHIRFMQELNRSLKDAGQFVMAQGLTAPDQAKLVRAGQDGLPVTDGAFAESKEFLAGFWMIEVAAPQDAYRIAARASAAPGPGGVPLNMPIEVREVMSRPPDSL